MLLDGAYPLFQPLDSFLYLTVGELDECTSFPELIIHMLTVIGMTPIEVHLESFRHKLKFMPESFSKDACVASRISTIRPKRFRHNVSVPLDPSNICPKGFSGSFGELSDLDNFCPKCFGRSADDLLNLGQ